MLFVLKSFMNSLLYVKSNECRSALRKLQHSNPYNSIVIWCEKKFIQYSNEKCFVSVARGP